MEQFEVDQQKDASRRWKEQAERRSYQLNALAHGNYLQSDSPDRLRQWSVRQLRWLTTLNNSVEHEPPPAVEQLSNEFLEGIIEKSDLLSIEFFELGLQAAACVGRIVTERQPNGTGFLVAPGLMLTNHHVLPTQDVAASSELELDFEENRVGTAKPSRVFSLLPATFFVTSKKLDFTFTAVETSTHDGFDLDTFRFLPLIREEGKVRIGQGVNIIQHPRGMAKQVVVRNNRVVDLPERYEKKYLHYEADTQKGSSGSPVFNDWWEVIALHHCAVPVDSESEQESEGREPPNYGNAPEQTTLIGNEGIRISRIVQALAEADLDPEMDRYRSEALNIWKKRGQPSISEKIADNPGLTTGKTDTGEESTRIDDKSTSHVPARPRLLRISHHERQEGRFGLTMRLQLSLTLGRKQPRKGRMCMMIDRESS